MESALNSAARRKRSLDYSIERLTELREMVALPPPADLLPAQWSAIEQQLGLAVRFLRSRLKAPRSTSAAALRLRAGAVEQKLALVYEFFDTYMDLLTQRHARPLGRLLRGCDVLALDGLRRDHPRLERILPPLVYCDRGFGASTLREGLHLKFGLVNPLPLVQIPYVRLSDKCKLTSVLHEAGHQAVSVLRLGGPVRRSIRAALRRAGAPVQVIELFSGWSRETAPDFWCFCASGMAQAAGLREILELPRPDVFRLARDSRHPPPYLRVLLAFAFCRRMWGSGIWDCWEEQWRALYPLYRARASERLMHSSAERYLDVVADVLLETRFAVLQGRPIPALFQLDALSPAALQCSPPGSRGFRALPPSAQLASFRLRRERTSAPVNQFEGEMTRWLTALGHR